MNIWSDLVLRCITQRHLNERWKTHTHVHTRAHPPDSPGMSLNVPHLCTRTIICFLGAAQSDMLLKTCLKSSLKWDPTHLWCRQTSTGRKKPFHTKRTSKRLNHKPGAANLDRLGSGRKWCHGPSRRSPDADKVVLRGKGNKRQTDNPFLL